MRLIKPSFEIIEQKDLFKHIELCGRVCYKSEDRITEDSAKKFVENLIKSGHTSVLEHGTVYLKIPLSILDVSVEYDIIIYKDLLTKYQNNEYTVFNEIFQTIPEEPFGYTYITTNYRVIVENGWEDDLQYQCEPTEYHEKRYSVRFVCDRGVSHEFVRHRVFSFSQESTRFCNYSKEKFDKEVTFIIPPWLDKLTQGIYGFDPVAESIYKIIPKGNDDYDTEDVSEDDYYFLRTLGWASNDYEILLHSGYSPQQARMLLPNALKTELIMTGFASQWEHLFKLRTASNAHPQARELAIPLKEEFIKKGYIKDAEDKP